MERDASDHMGIALSQHVQSGAGAAELTDDVIALWRQTEAALVPVLGRRGVTVLFKRALTLTGRTSTWLADVDHQSLTEMDLEALRLACLTQTADTVAVGAGGLFKAFHEVLSSLIGEPLTVQLLSPVSLPTFNDANQEPGQ